MKILITNDDSISSPVLLPLIRWAEQFGEVITVVPKAEQSGKSHSIEIHKAFEVTKVTIAPDIEIYTVDSSPADCVRYACIGLNQTYDLVISGINKGLNLGIDMIYSGTVGAIFEAACFNIPGIALSTVPETFDTALAYLDTVYQFFKEYHLWDHCKYYNVNIPLNPKGIRITRQGGRYYSDEFLPQEGNLVRPHGFSVFEPSGTDALDTDAVLHYGYISILPLTLNRTDMQVFHALSESCKT